MLRLVPGLLLLALAAPGAAGDLAAFRAEAGGLAAWADVRGGRLEDGGPVIFRATAGRPDSTRLLAGAGLALLAPGPGRLALLVFGRGEGRGARLDLLVDGDPAATGLSLPAGPMARHSFPVAFPVRSGARVELRLARGSAPARIAALALDLAPGAPPARRRPAPDPGALPVHEFYPTSLGLRWEFVDEADGGRRFALQVSERLVYKGAKVAKFRRMDKQDEYDLVGDEAGIRCWARRDDLTGFMDYSDQPVPFSAGPWVRVGDRYEATPKGFVNPITGGHLRWVIKATRMVDVAVPYGAFPGCLQLDITNTDTKSLVEISKFRFYLARGVGVVWRQGRIMDVTFNQKLVAR